MMITTLGCCIWRAVRELSTQNFPVKTKSREEVNMMTSYGTVGSVIFSEGAPYAALSNSGGCGSNKLRRRPQDTIAMNGEHRQQCCRHGEAIDSADRLQLVARLYPAAYGQQAED